MKPASEQIEIANCWLDDQIPGYKKHGYFIVMPAALRQAMKSGVDFTGGFAGRGIAPNGFNSCQTFLK